MKHVTKNILGYAFDEHMNAFLLSVPRTTTAGL